MNKDLMTNVKSKNSLTFNRSVFDLSHSINTTFKSGDLVPFDCLEVYPGDNIRAVFTDVIRMLSPLVPVMGNAYQSVHAFYIPSRIIAPWNGDDFEEIVGVNKKGFWAPETLPEVSTVSINQAKIEPMSVANYLGLPSYSNYTGKADYDFELQGLNPYPFIAYAMIWDYFYRDENLQSPKLTIKSHSNVQSLVNTFSKAGSCLPVNKLHDIFTSCLPSPQKGDPIRISLGSSAPVYVKDAVLNANAPVVATGTKYDLGNTIQFGSSDHVFGYVNGSLVLDQDGFLTTDKSGYQPDDQGFINSSNLAIKLSSLNNQMYADLSNAVASTINDLRLAIAMQRLLEADARGGTRYTEFLKAHYGITASTSLVQQPQYLGGLELPINITQVLQTSQSTGDSPLGATGAFSNTSGNGYLCNQGFLEHGYILFLTGVRTEQTYCQGIEKMWTRKGRYDYYMNELSHLGEQPIMKYQLLASKKTVDISKSLQEQTLTFGYNEAWIDLRHQFNKTTGNLAPTSGDVSLAPWTYTNLFSSNGITLNDEFIRQSSTNIGQTLVDSDTSSQFVMNAYLNIRAVREVPSNGTPGLSRI